MNESMKMQPGFADVIDQFGDPLRTRLSRQGHQVLNQIQACRTAALGGQLLRCDHCKQHHLQYHSCRNRHCPQCGYQASQQWIEDRMKDVLPLTYHHLVFTLPHQLNPWVGRYRETLYRLLFTAVWSTLKSMAADPRRLNGKLGATLVLHTWGQTLTRHVHMHCLVPGGALQANGQWHAAKSNYLFPVRALSRLYRGKMVSLLRASRDTFDQYDDQQIDQMLNELMAQEWVVYSKPVMSQTQTVVEYLARYTKRIGLSNARLLKMDSRYVWLKYRDYRNDGRHRVMQLEGGELLRRFLLHMLPKRFMRVRYYGYLANVHRRRKLAQIRQALNKAAQMKQDRVQEKVAPGYRPLCQVCKGIMTLVRTIVPERRALKVGFDSG
jgi:hypothetical protein